MAILQCLNVVLCFFVWFFPNHARGLAHPSPNKRLLILGLGKVGSTVAQQASVDNVEWIKGTSRSCLNDDDDGGIEIPHHLAHKYLKDATHVLLTFLPPPENEILDSLSSLETNPWIGFISTTGVYGNHDGNWVTEESSLLCTPESSAYPYIEFEKNVLSLKSNVCIFRCAGLYGPTRSALHTVWKRGFRQQSQDDSGENVTNRIHERDVASAIVQAMENSCSGIFNLADDEPAKRSIVLKMAYDLFCREGIPVKDDAVESTTVDARTKRRRVERKLVSNEKMKRLLLPRLAYPTYREGLEAIFLENEWQE